MGSSHSVKNIIKIKWGAHSKIKLAIVDLLSTPNISIFILATKTKCDNISLP